MRQQLETRKFRGQLERSIDLINDRRNTMNGHPFYEFVFITEDLALRCRIYEDAYKFNGQGALLLPNCELAITGKFEPPHYLTVQQIKDPLSQTTTTTRIIEEYGSLEEYHGALWGRILKARELGLVPVLIAGCVDFRKRDHCVHRDGQWMPKMEYAVSILGGTYVTKRLKAAKLTEGTVPSPGSTRNSVYAERVHAMREELFEEAKRYEESGGDVF